MRRWRQYAEIALIFLLFPLLPVPLALFYCWVLGLLGFAR